jgi:WhiB family transcriptional regulator, redox-sensing transcriptional regulator
LAKAIFSTTLGEVTDRIHHATQDATIGWRAHAACSGYPDALFFPIGDVAESEVQMALEICAGCRVIEECLDYALESNQRSGIWGGTTEKERRALRRRWLADRRRTA